MIRRHISQSPKKLSTSLNETPAPPTDSHLPDNTVVVSMQQDQFHKNYAVQDLTSGFELAVIALQLQRCRHWRVLTYVDSQLSQQPLQGSTVLGESSKKLAQKVFGTRIRLSELLQSQWHTDPGIRDHAQKLADTIADLVNFVWKFDDTPGGLLELEGEFSEKREISWNLLVETQGANSEGPCREGVPLFVQRDRIEGQKWKPWEVGDSRIDALLHLWIQQLRTDNVEDGNMLWLLCPQGDHRAPIIADWWIGRESCIVKGQELEDICREYSIVRSCGTAQGCPDKRRIVDCVGIHKALRNGTSSAIPEAATGPIARAIIQNMTLIGFTTQYILYTFLCELVSSIARITPETQIEEGTGKGTALLANKAITELAHKIQERGLMGVADAYRMIVCALHAEGKLPLATPKESNVLSVFNIYNDALELGIRVKRKDIFQEAQEILASEVEWLLAQNRVKEAAVLLIKAIQRCKVLSLASGSGAGGEDWVNGRLGAMMESVANQFVSVITKPVSSSSSIGTCANTMATPAVPESLMASRVGLSLEDRLEAAICSNDLAVVHTLSKNGTVAHNKSPSPSGACFLGYAAREHHEDMIILLQLHGASLARAPMWWAIEGGRGSSEDDCIAVLKLLAELGSNPNIAEPHTGQLPLHAAARLNFAKVVAWLMTESGYDISVDAGDSEGLTALHHAARGGHDSMVRSLIEVYHADINIGSTTDKKTALHHAAIHGDLVVLEMLCDQAGIDLEACCSEGKSAVLYASQKGHCTIIEALAARGADVNAKDALTGTTALHLAAIEGQAGAIQLLLDRGANIDDPDKDGKTALHHAAKEARGLVVYTLLSKGASCDLCDKSGKTALDYAKYTLVHDSCIAPKAMCEGIVWALEHRAVIKVTNTGDTEMQRAAARGDILAVEMLLAIGVDTEEKDCNGWTALQYALLHEHEQVAQALLDGGANIENPNQNLATPLHIAVTSELERIVQQLLKRGAKVDARGAHGATPLHIAAENGDERIVELLLECGAETEVKLNDFGITPLHVATERGHERVIQLLLKAGAETEAKMSDFGITPLHIAIGGGGELEGGVEAGAKMNHFNTTPLHVAVERGDERVVQLLLGAGAEIDAKGKASATPLHVAAERGNERVVRLLLEGGAEIEATNENGATPLHVAVESGHEQVVQLLLKAIAKTDAKLSRSGDINSTALLHLAVESGHERIVQLLLEGGAEIDAKGKSGATPLHIAAERNNERVVRLLLEHDARIDAKAKDGATPLYVAALYGNEQVVQLLLEHDAEIETANENGATPLYIAAQNGQELVVKLLLDAGAKIDAKEKSGTTPLFIAASNGHEWIVGLLQDAGARARDSYGRTLLHVAMRAQNPSMLTFLIERGVDPSIKDNAGKIAGDYVQDPYDGCELNPHVLDIWRNLQSRMEEVRVQEQNSNPEGMSEGVGESEPAV